MGELRYTNLPAGDLKLLLQPVNESGVWGEVVTLPIRVRPPFWMTLWFRLSGILFLLAAAVGVYRWRTLLLRRRNRELEKEVGKRTAELEYLATYDPLTALFNRRAILAFLEKELKPERGCNRQLGCIMVDLNRFKAVNDTLGHAAGDGVLKEMAAKIQECLRQGDALGRLGGDEFLVVLPGADPEALQAVCGRISELICAGGRRRGSRHRHRLLRRRDSADREYRLRGGRAGPGRRPALSGQALRPPGFRGLGISNLESRVVTAVSELLNYDRFFASITIHEHSFGWLTCRTVFSLKN